MAFGRKNTSQSRPTQSSSETEGAYISETQNMIDVEDEVQQGQSRTTKAPPTQEKDASRPLAFFRDCSGEKSKDLTVSSYFKRYSKVHCSF